MSEVTTGVLNEKKSVTRQALREINESNTLFLNLLSSDLFDQVMLDSSRFEAIINSSKNKFKRVAVDEIQKLPKLISQHRNLGNLLKKILV